MSGIYPSLYSILLTVSPAPVATVQPPPPRTIVLRHCTVEFSRATRLGSPLPGVIQDCLVKLGDEVRAGQVLRRLQDRELRAELELRETEARSDIGIRTAQAKYELAVVQLRIAEQLSRQKAIGTEELQKLNAEAKTGSLAVLEAKLRQAVAEIQRRQTEAALRTREFICPHDGAVVAIYRTPAESVNVNEPVFRVVATDRLQITGALDVPDAWRVRPDQTVRVFAEVGGADLEVAKTAFIGRVIFVDREIDKRTQTCKVVAEVENHGRLLRSGLEARMEILPETPTVQKASAR